MRFPHVSQLILDDKWSDQQSLQSLKSLVNLSKIVKLIRLEPVPAVAFQSLLSELPRLQSLTLTTLLLDDLHPTQFQSSQCLSSLNVVQLSDDHPYYVNVESFCAVFPRIKHLDFPVHRLESCQYVVDHLQRHLISVVFRFSIDNEEYDDDENSEFHHQLVHWARHVRRYHKYRVRDGDVYLWLSAV